MVKLNPFLNKVPFLFFPLLISACSTNLAECGDQNIIDTVKQVSVDIYKDHMVRQFANRDAYVANRLGYGTPMGSFFIKKEQEKNAIKKDDLIIEVSKIDFITTTKYDKDLPKRECSGEIVFKVAKKANDQNQVMGDFLALGGKHSSGGIKYPESAMVDYFISPNAQDKSNMIVNVSLKFK